MLQAPGRERRLMREAAARFLGICGYSRDAGLMRSTLPSALSVSR